MSTNLLEKTTGLEPFAKLESEVRGYIRSFPTVFAKSQNYTLWNEEGKEYIDFFAGAGTLNYGHNNPAIKRKLLDYLMNDGVIHGLDMATKAKRDFLQRFEEVILQPRGMNHKVMFPGPTGTNAVESALKIARKVTGRDAVMCFTNAFHGMTLGSLAVTGNSFKRGGAGTTLSGGIFMPYDKFLGEHTDTVEYIEAMLQDKGSGVPIPAAVILETVQGEGGINVADFAWIKRMEQLCRRWDILLIVDDIQMGCGRTGTFFSFERAGIEPDIVCLSKSIGGYGLPMALTLIKPELDIWEPGEHNGTFRGNNLGFVAATEALNYWIDGCFTAEIDRKALKIQEALADYAASYPELQGTHRGRGLIQGLAFDLNGAAEQVSAEAFARGLIMETSGTESQVLKVMPPLTIDDTGLERGLEILEDSIAAVRAQVVALHAK